MPARARAHLGELRVKARGDAVGGPMYGELIERLDGGVGVAI